MVKVAVARTAVGGVLGHVPLVERAYARRALRRTDHVGLFAGVYDSYAAAEREIPASRRRGWDNEESASIWLFKIDHMQPTAYAPFFWLSKLLQPGMTLVDYGGSIGLSYYAYVKRRELPEGARWVIVELPHLVEVGTKMAQRQKAAQLEFATELAGAPRCDILFSAGALQYMEHSVPGLLEKMAALPKHILLNKVPLHRERNYWTLQNFGTAVSPYRVYEEGEFLGYFEKAGYVLRDRWAVPELSCEIPFHPREFVAEFTGLYFEKR
jgi:putative methyltransferase (TIGR04325 family)